MKVVSLTDVGMRRDNNEDYFKVNEQINLFIVADGIGGHNAGEIASRIACESIENSFIERLNLNDLNFERDIEAILMKANKEIKSYSILHPESHNMGTTIVVAYFVEEMLYIANVGDSRCYLINDVTMHQITKDHSLVAELIKLGSISEAEAIIHPDRNVITSALGIDETFKLYQTKIPYFEYKQTLLCTDGLTNLLSKEEIFDFIKNNTLEVVPQKLIESVNQNGGFDNVTVICIEM